ncbi:MAG: hypothetical protein ACLFUC_06195 [Bacteroidales bacterium]
MRLIINIDSDKHGKELAKFLRSVEYVKSVEFDNTDIPLTEDDWCMPGRSATDKEIEELAEAMDSEEGGIESKDFFNNLRKNLSA